MSVAEEFSMRITQSSSTITFAGAHRLGEHLQHTITALFFMYSCTGSDMIQLELHNTVRRVYMLSVLGHGRYNALHIKLSFPVLWRQNDCNTSSKSHFACTYAIEAKGQGGRGQSRAED